MARCIPPRPRAALSGPTTAHTQPPSLPAPCGSQNILPGADTSIGQLRAAAGAAPDSRRATTTSATTQTKRPQLGALRRPPARRRVSAKPQNIFALLFALRRLRRLCGAAAASVRAAAAPGAPDRRTGRAHDRRRLRIRLGGRPRPGAGGLVPLRRMSERRQCRQNVAPVSLPRVLGRDQATNRQIARHDDSRPALLRPSVLPTARPPAAPEAPPAMNRSLQAWSSVGAVVLPSTRLRRVWRPTDAP